MNAPRSRKASVSDTWPRIVSLGRTSVKVYRRVRADGSTGYEVANYADGKRKLESHPTEKSALDRANDIARKISSRDVLAAAMTNEQASEYTSMLQTLAPFKVSLHAAASTLAECLKLVYDLPSLHDAAKAYAKTRQTVVKKPVSEIVTELLEVKKARRGSKRYLEDLRSRLNNFAADFKKNAADVTTAEIQAWLDRKQLAAQTYQNFRRVIHLFFEFSVARGYASENPAAKVESVEIRGGKTEIFTPDQITKLLSAAPTDFLPSLAIGAFAGLRSAEIERLEWSDIDFTARCIKVTADKAKTASRRVVPLADNLAAWLAMHPDRTGKIWKGTHDAFYAAQEATAEASGVAWKANALRHSYASYRFALTGDAGRVAGELGNSAAVVHKHYRELVTPDNAAKWFKIQPTKE